MYMMVVLCVMVEVGLAAVVNVAGNSKSDNNKLVEKLKQDLLHKNEDYYNDYNVHDSNNNNSTLSRGLNETNTPTIYTKYKRKRKIKEDKTLNLKNSLTQERDKGMRRHLESDISVEEFVHSFTNTSTNKKHKKTITHTQTHTDESTTTFKPYTFRVHDINKDDVQTPPAVDTTTTTVLPTVQQATVKQLLRVSEDSKIKSRASDELNDNNKHDVLIYKTPPIATLKIMTRKTTPSTVNTSSIKPFLKIKKRKKIEFDQEVPLGLLSESEETQLDTHELDMLPAVGIKIDDRRLRGKLCERSILIPEGPKYDSKGQVYLPAYRQGPRGADFANTKAPGMLLPRCCNCCHKSVLGCQ